MSRDYSFVYWSSFFLVPILSADSYREQLSHVLSHIQMRQAHSQNCNSGVKGGKFDPLYISYIIRLMFLYSLNTQGQNVFSITAHTLDNTIERA